MAGEGKNKAKIERETALKLPEIIPPQIAELLGESPLILGEDENEYWNLCAQFASAIQPKDFVEWVWVRDILDLTWEIRRLRRLKAAYLREQCWIRFEIRFHTNRWFEPKYDDYSDEDMRGMVEDLRIDWRKGDPEALQEFKRIMADHGTDMDALTSDIAIGSDSVEFVRADRMIERVEKRRGLLLREIERRRDGIARRLKDTSIELVEEIEIATQNSNGNLIQNSYDLR